MANISRCSSPSDLVIDLGEDTYSEDADGIDEQRNGKSPDWPKEDDMELFQRIKKALPVDDTMKYRSRINHIDWETISFKEYSAEDCKQRWVYVQEHLRRYRLVHELVEDAITWRMRPWTNFNKGSKCQEHPDYPKKPLTSYMIFFMEKKDEILAKQPRAGGTDLSKVIAKLYNHMNEPQKLTYIEKAMKEKEQFEVKLKKFMLDHPDYTPLKCLKSSPKAVPPKVPTPFNLFCNVKMDQLRVEGIRGNEMREKCREMFKELEDEQRLEWIYKSLQQEKQYEEDFAKFKVEHPEIEIGAKKSLLSKDEKNLKERTEGKPGKPPNSGYSLFSKKMLLGSSLKHLGSKDRMAEVSRMWKQLQDEEKKMYNDEVQQLMINYKIKHASYLDSLQPDQRILELKKSQSKVATTKRSLAKPKQPKGKKIKLENEQVVVKSEDKFINNSSEEEAKEDNSSTPDEDFSYSSSD